MAISIKRQVIAARKRNDALVNRIYACAPDNQTRFTDCLKLASFELVREYDLNRRTIAELEYAAVAAGKAYPAKSGGLIWN
jgi:hypothetical protein